MKNSNIILLIFLFAAITGCSTYNNIYSDYDRSVDFTQYKTFAWLPDTAAQAPQKDALDDPRYDNDIIRNNTKNYVNHCLSNRKYFVSPDSPDVVLQLVLLNEKKERVVTYPGYNSNQYYNSNYYYNNSYYYPYYYPYYDNYTYYNRYDYSSYNYSPSETYKETYVQGTIIINMYDRKQKKIVWSGVAEGDIYDPEYLQYDIHPAVHDIMETFPIETKKVVSPRLINQ